MVTDNRTLLANIWRRILLGGALLLLFGCSSTNQSSEPLVENIPDPADLMILKAVTSVSANIKSMAKKDLPPATSSHSEDSVQEPRFIDIKWNGPLETLLLLLSQYYAIKLQIVGTPPMAPVIINLSQTGLPLDEIIKAIAQHDTVPSWVKLTMSTDEIKLVYVTP